MPKPVLLRVLPGAFDVIARATRALHLTGRSRRGSRGDTVDVADRRPFLDTDATWRDVPDEITQDAEPARPA